MFEFTILLMAGYFFYCYKFTLKNISFPWLSPPALFTFTMFFYIFTGSLLIYIGTLTYDRFSATLFTEENLNRANYLTVLATSSMWFAFLIFTKKTSSGFKQSFSKKVLFNKPLASTLLFLTSVSYIWGIINGFVGYSKNTEVTSTFSSLLSLFNSISFLILIGYYFTNYEKIKSKRFDPYFILLITVLVFIGIISGSKFSIILPFIYIGLIDYFKSGDILTKKNLYIVLLFISSFIVIIPIRNVLQDTRKGNSNVDVVEIFSSIGKDDSVSEPAFFLAFLSRITYIPPLVLAMEYEGPKPPAVTNLWYYKFMSPIYAFTPRVINPGKPEITFGKWFSFNVYGSTEDNNIGATYQGILYMNGGLISVLFGFLIVGMVQALFVNFLFNNKYLPVYLLLLLKMVFLSQEPWAFYTGFIQTLVLMLIVYNFIFKRK